MNQRFLISLVAGMAVAAALIFGILTWRGGDKIQPTGRILKLRSTPIDELHCLVVIDLRLANNSNIALEIQETNVSVEPKEGGVSKGAIVSGVDTKSLFTYYPVLGEAYNDPLIANTRIGPQQTLDFMLAARLDLPESSLAGRRLLSVTARDRSGISVELLEKSK